VQHFHRHVDPSILPERTGEAKAFFRPVEHGAGELFIAAEDRPECNRRAGRLGGGKRLSR
jgi:hypothetical protein